ncbi:Rv3654c family TadE-like protein [uncultured Corynebacterium sp.]|uniref:Rv3654c family TadE-like protein n=1 Tax=uncultured Corynebacterium sp. TaxID=159447 RepID=UPI0025F0ADC2|nr:Rv3654c family TadE-like protein [uncultured Corynebacterium sp.]
MAVLGDERGSTTVTAAFLTTVVLALTMVAIDAGAGLVEQRRADVAADLAAVAGAVDAQRGGDGCDAAAGIAADNGADLSDCVRDGEDVQVIVERGAVSATARAGPIEDVG